MIMIRLQVTIFDKSNTYKPISTTIEVENVEYYYKNKGIVHHKAIEKICAKRYTTPKLLSQNGYNQIKVRIYKTHSEQQKENKIKELQKLMELRRKLK